MFCAAAFSLVCTDLCSGMYSNEGSVIRTTYWCTSQSAPRLRASASKCKACSLLHYCTLYLLLYFFSTTFIQRLEILCRLRLLRVDWLLLLICDQSDMLWVGLSERMLHHILRLTTKRNKKTLMLIIENILILISAFIGPSLIIRTTADQCFLSQKYTNTLSGYCTCTT